MFLAFLGPVLRSFSVEGTCFGFKISPPRFGPLRSLRYHDRQEIDGWIGTSTDFFWGGGGCFLLKVFLHVGSVHEPIPHWAPN